jgi:hypothetical protein
VIEPDKDEAQVRMKREALKRIAWLAAVGFRVYTHPGYAQMRVGERFNKQNAELTARLLDDFERKIATGFLLFESDEEKEQRFTSHWNRPTVLFQYYP